MAKMLRRPKVLVPLIIVAIVIVGFAAYYVTQLAVAPPLEELVISQKADLTTIDMQAATDAPTLNVFGHVYDTLFKIKFDEKGAPYFSPNLVESYKQINSTAWQFTLKSGVKFHDGTPLDSTAVKVSFERGPKVGALPRTLLGAVKAIGVVDKQTVVIGLKAPFAPLIAHLTHPSTAIVPPKIADIATKDFAVAHIIGSGPFKFLEFVKGERTVLVRNEEYWGEKATVKRIVWKPIADDSTRVTAIETGTVDIATHIPSHMVKTLKDKKFTIVDIPSVRTIFMLINTEKITDAKVRQAFNLAVDKDAIVSKILLGAGSVSTAPIAPAIFGYSKISAYEYSPDKAKALLAEAKFPADKEIVLITPTGRYLQDREVAEAVASYLRAIGLKVKTEVLEWAAYIPRASRSEFDIAVLGWGTVTMDADYGLHPLFHSTAGTVNWGKYKNTKVDGLLDQAKEEADTAKRLSIYKEAQSIIMSDCPWIFLYVENIIVAMKPGLKNVEIQPIERWVLTYAAKS